MGRILAPFPEKRRGKAYVAGAALSPSLPLPLARSSSEVAAQLHREAPEAFLVHQSIDEAVAALRESQPLPPLTRAWLSLITLTFRALGRNHTVSAPCEGIALLGEITLCQHLVRASQRFVKKKRRNLPRSLCPPFIAPAASLSPSHCMGKFRLTLCERAIMKSNLWGPHNRQSNVREGSYTKNHAKGF